MPLDILMNVPRFPPPDGKINATGLTVQGGGPVPNALTGLARLGHSGTLITAVGNDPFAEISLEEIRKEGVDCRLVLRKRGPSDCAIGYVESGSGRRTLVFHPGAAVRPADIKTADLPHPAVIHLDGRHLEACMKLARWGRKHKAIISFDIGSVRNDVSPLLPLVDHLVVADAFALGYTGCRSAKQAVLKLAEKCPGTIVITCGLKGQMAYDRERFWKQEAFPVKAADTTGAGDGFHVGYIHGLLEGAPLAKRLQLGSAVAALNCTAMGARAGLPGRRQLSRFLLERSPVHA